MYNYDQSYNLMNSLDAASFERLILRKMIDPNAHKDDGWTLLHAACDADYTDKIHLLLHYNANPIATTANDEITPLHVLAMHNDVEAINCYLEYAPEALHCPKTDGFFSADIALTNHNNASAAIMLLHNSPCASLTPEEISVFLDDYHEGEAI